MKMVKSLLLGSAAGLVAIAGAQAADLPVKAKPVQYVKICSLYGAGFYYIPGTDTCIKIGGYVRAEWNYQAANSFKPRISYNFDDPQRERYNERTRGGLSFDVRSQTAYGTLRAYGIMLPTTSEDGGPGGTPYTPTLLSPGAGSSALGNPGVFVPAMFIQFAGFTFGRTASFFDFDLNPYTNATIHAGSTQAGNGIQVFAYTAQFGGGFSATLSAEDPTPRRTLILGGALTASSTLIGDGIGYGGRRWPDVVANLRVDQAWGSAQLMGALHDVYANTSTPAVVGPPPVAATAGSRAEVGWAVGAGVRINLPSWGHGDYLLGQVQYAEGASNYLFNQSGVPGSAASGGLANLQEGYPGVTKRAYGYVDDAFITGGGLSLTKGWALTGGYEHIWNPQWKTSLYGSYVAFQYSAAASAAIAAVAGGGAAGSADWNMWQIGSRTVWTPAQNLDLSVDVLYTKVDGAFSGSGTRPLVYGSNDIVSAMFRAQRNFWP